MEGENEWRRGDVVGWVGKSGGGDKRNGGKDGRGENRGGGRELRI